VNRSHAAQVRLRIVIECPPSGVDYALQRGRGRSYEAVQSQRSTGADLLFEFSVIVKIARGGGPPVLTGPFVQGPPSARFIYVDIGEFAGQTETRWSRRLKIPLIGITWAMVDRGTALETRVAGTARDGSPTCATVKAFRGWR
jgi:hypothetical protein